MAWTVGRGEKVKFWSDVWVGEQPLVNQFPRIFLNSTQKDDLVIHMGEWVEREWRWKSFGV